MRFDIYRYIYIKNIDIFNVYLHIYIKLYVNIL
jgi:hypothetical protein